LRVPATIDVGRRPMESGGSYALLLERAEYRSLVRVPEKQRRRVPFETRAVTARPHVLLHQGFRWEPDRDDRSRVHALRAWVARSSRRRAVSTRSLQSVLPLAPATRRTQPINAEIAENAELPGATTELSSGTVTESARHMLYAYLDEVVFRFFAQFAYSFWRM